MNATITGNQLVLSSDTATVATAETFALTFVPDWVYPEIYVRAEQDDTRVEVLVSEESAVVPLGVGTWDISVVGRKNGTDLMTNKVKLYVDRPDIHHIVSEEAGNQITELTDGLYLGYPNVSDYAGAVLSEALTGNVDFCNFYGLRFVNINIANENEFVGGTAICSGLNLPEKEVHQGGFTITTEGVLSKDETLTAGGAAKALLVYV